MASANLHENGGCSDDMHIEHISPFCDGNEESKTFSQIPLDPDPFDEFGEPDILPRIGDQYQVLLPYGECKRVCYSTQNSIVEYKTHSHHSDLVDSSIPLKWTCVVKNGVKNETCSESKRDHGGLFVPELSGEEWSEAEKASFLLGLYIFEKKFVEVRRLIETKEIGAILSFYYGEFHGSDKYHRWSECRKIKSKKCVFGRRIFSGLRQQELLSRILPTIPDERHNDLFEISKTFIDDKMSLADYIASVKDVVGMSVLVKAVGIGTGKQDLTRMVMEPSRSNQAISTRSEIPTGRACSSLTTAEIIKFLSGDYRLSKARANDLFWEAIWPRLLARGWQSEQPKNRGYLVSSKNCLVFLVPGIKKFSRWRLVKGDHYFDSVPDVLSKVAKEPELIELDAEKDDSKNEYKCAIEGMSGEDDNNQPIRQRPSYLQPRTPNRDSRIKKFTVVDTSLLDGKIRELRSLPSEISNRLPSWNVKEEHDDATSHESVDESDTISTILFKSSMVDNLSFRTAKSGKKTLLGNKVHERRCSYQDPCAVCPDISLISLKKKKDLRPNKEESRKVVKSMLNQNLKRGNNYETLVTKTCRKLAPISHKEANNMATRLDNGTSSCCSDIHDFTENLSSYAGSCQDKLSSTNSSQGSPTKSVECYPQTQTTIDLNLPHVFSDLGKGILTAELSKEQNNETLTMDNQCLPKSSSVEAKSEQQSALTTRRHGTRIRPPTTKALEALESGYLTMNRRRKIKDAGLRENISSRPVQRARDGVCPNDANSFVLPQIEQAENGMFDNGNSYMFGNFQVLTESKESVEDK